MIGVVGVILEEQRLLLNNGVALLTDVLAEAPSFLSVVTWAAQMPDGAPRGKEKTDGYLIRYFIP